MRIILAAVLLVVATHVRAQELNIGDTKEAVRKSFSTPPSIFSVPLQETFPFAEEEFAGKVGATLDVWELPSMGNAFEVTVSYSPDSSQSRLHPTMRVKDVRFLPDKDQSGMLLIQQIASIRHLCAATCVVTGMRSHDDDFTAFVCPKNPSSGSAALAAGAYEGWGASTSGGVYSVCVEILYGKHPEFHRTPLAKVPFSGFHVNYFHLSGVERNILLQLGELSAIGSWTP